MVNEHIIYAYAECEKGDYLLIVGITDIGWEYLKNEPGNYLDVSPPIPSYHNINKVIIVRGKDKEEVKNLIYKAAALGNVPVKEVKK